MNVWVVELVIEYEPGAIMGVYSSKEQAEQALSEYLAKQVSYHREDFEVTEWPVDHLMM